MGRKAYIKEASKALDLTDYQLRRMAKEGKIPFLMSGTRYIFDIELCEEFLRKQALANVNREEDSKKYGVLRKIEV